MKVNEIMTSPALSVKPEATIRDIAGILVQHNISGVPVVDDNNRLLGVVSESDLLFQRVKAMKPSFWDFCSMAMDAGIVPEERNDLTKIFARTAGEVMSSPAVSVDEDTDVAEAGQLMMDRHIKRLPVTSIDGKLIGIISRHSFMQLALENK